MINEQATIDKIELYEVAIPLKEPFQISGGVSHFRRSLIVVLSSGDFKGYGEAAPFEEPYYSSETISSVKMLYKELLIPRLLGKTIDSIEEMNEVLNEGVRGNAFAKAGIENAYWDLLCQKNNKNMKQMIEYKMEQMGVPKEFMESKDHIKSGVSIGIPVDGKIETLRQWAQEYIDEGYQRIKIKIRPGWDLEPLAAVREQIGDFPLWIDANSAYDLEKHKETLEKMDHYDLLFYEQPLHHDDILDHASLAANIKTPICLDESLKSERVARQALESGASKIWNIKIQRIGGLLEGIKIYKLAVENGVQLWGGTMPESGIGAIPILNLATFKGFVYPADIEASARWYGEGQDTIELTMSQEGDIVIPEGISVESMINFNNFHKYGTLISIDERK
ncbi:MAG: o-succinylbenzoate synthase [Epulopiscium sp.]|nr:o-succinylbenzoate synthase [Candidatus Epulonipiscium sp.]